MAATAREIAAEHPFARHPLFDYLDRTKLNHQQICSFLANYDAHASLLRRLLLKAATLMPEEAVGYILSRMCAMNTATAIPIIAIHTATARSVRARRRKC